MPFFEKNKKIHYNLANKIKKTIHYIIYKYAYRYNSGYSSNYTFYKNG